MCWRFPLPFEVSARLPRATFTSPLAPPTGDLPLRFDHIATEQGLSNLDVWSVLRDNQGFMWFGTLDGLDRYDGYTDASLQA